MKRLDKMLATLKDRYTVNMAVVSFSDGTQQEVGFYEAMRLCFEAPNVVDVYMQGDTGTSLLRAILKAEKDVSDLPELQEDETH